MTVRTPYQLILTFVLSGQQEQGFIQRGGKLGFPPPPRSSFPPPPQEFEKNLLI